MARGLAVLLSTVAVIHVARASYSVNKFPPGFMLGAAASAYQVEGAWNEDGKGENIWDRMFHEHPEYSADGNNGDVASDSYHKYPEDVKALKAIGANTYRFSISWARILPTGDLDVINQAGINHYNKLINLLLANGIQPMVTIYHWDLPQALQYIGGWPNPLIADYFVEYARILFQEFGDRVKWWITFNEPCIFTRGYSEVAFQAPSMNSSGIGNYLAAHTALRAHGMVYRLYDREFRPKQKGKVGFTFNSGWYEPAEDAKEYREAQRLVFEFVLGRFAHPIFVDGDYPAVVRERVDRNSKAEGRPRSRLPCFTEEEKRYIRGSADFFGLNMYTATLVKPGEEGISPSWERDSGVIRYYDESWPRSAAVWLRVVPWGMRKLLNWVATKYPGKPIFITENGYADRGELDDQGRISYIGSHLAEVLKAINIDGVNVLGYNVWSLIDSLEYTSGYSERFGLFHVDINCTERTRTPKSSAKFIRDIYRSKTVPKKYFQ